MISGGSMSNFAHAQSHRRSLKLLVIPIFLLASARVFLSGHGAFVSGLQSRDDLLMKGRAEGLRIARRAEDDQANAEAPPEDDNDEEEIDLENDPNWLKVKKEMGRIWDMRYEDRDWLIADDIKGIMDEHLQTIIGKKNYLEMEDIFAEVAEEEPKPGEISKEDFEEIAGAYVYGLLYTE
mmetsp:Transcript_44718/g.83512  ORF Transcript_44718/g.83512 Transcript_44718/m.83512 type:complete len:180 (+) Transcript_44718:37-576(+)